MKCHHCETELTLDCEVKTPYTQWMTYVKKKKGLFNSRSSQLKAAVCPGCGNVSLYVDDYKKFG